MDQSQKPAEPLTEVSPGAFLRQLNPESPPEQSPEAEENRRRAGAEISMIFELKDSTAFKWFFREFIEQPYERQFEALRDPRTASREKSTLEEIQAAYIALRKVRVGMLEREIAHREQIDANDVEIARLHAELARL